MDLHNNAPDNSGFVGASKQQQQHRPPLFTLGPAASGSTPSTGSRLGSAGHSPSQSSSMAQFYGSASGHMPAPSLPLYGQQEVTSPSSPPGTAGSGYAQRNRRRWTAEEDAKLIAAVNAYGSARGPGSAWSLISQGIPGRTNKDCRKRWFHSLDPSVRKGKWSPDEDDALRRLYAELGPQWKEIALRIPGRKDDQVSKRWRDVLAPELTSKKPWSTTEDSLLLELLEKLGPRWTAIADKLPGRSPIACRNRSRKFRKHRPDAVPDDLNEASGSTSATATASRSGSGSAVAAAGHGAGTLPRLGLATSGAANSTSASLPSAGAEDDAPDWRLPVEVNPQIPSNSFNFDLDQTRAAGHGPSGHSGGGHTGQGEQRGMISFGGPGGQPMNDAVMSHMHHSPTVETSRPMPQSSVSPPTHMEQPLQGMEAGWMQTQTQPPMQMQLPFDRAVGPVDDMWTLLMLLERGDSAVTVDSNLLRQLVAGAASGIGHPPAPRRN